MSKRVVFLVGVHCGRHGLVRQELKSSKWYCHRKRRGVREVECAETLVLVDISCAVRHRLVHSARVLNLHALLDDYSQRPLEQSSLILFSKYIHTIKGVHEGIAGNSSSGTTRGYKTALAL